MADIDMRILLQAVGAQQVLGSIQQLAGALTGGGGLVGALAGVGIAAAGAAIGIGVTAVKAAGDFQEQLTSLVTGAGEAQSNIKAVGDGILDMSIQTGTSTKQLTDGMYMIESAGFHGAAGLSVLKAAAQGAKVGNADLGTVANAVTTILTDYHMSANQASAATSALVTTVADGKTHMQDLSSAMGSVLPLASSLGISFPQVAGGIAVMTNAGMQAQRASMNLANAIRSLSAPNATAQKSMQAVGLTAQQLKDTLSTQGLTGAIQLVEKHVGSTFPAGSVQAVAAFKNIMGGATGYNVALMLGGKNMAAYEANVQNISAAMKNGKGDVQGWSEVQQDFNFKVAQAQQALNVLMIRIGQQLLPVVTQLLSAMLPVITAFTQWLTGGQAAAQATSIFSTVVKAVTPAVQETQKILQQVGAFLRATFVPAWQQVVSIFNSQIRPAFAQLMTALAPVVPMIEAIAIILGAVLVGAIGAVIKVFGAMLPPIASAIAAVIRILTGLVQFVVGVVSFLVDLVTGHFDKLSGDIALIWTGIKNIFLGIWQDICALFQAFIGVVTALCSGFVQGIVGFFQNLADILVGHSIVPDMINSIINYFANLPGQALSAVSSLVGMLGGFFSNLAAQALSWGANIVNSIASGISSAAGSVTSAISNVANAIGQYLPHSPAEKGELRHLNEYGPALVRTFANGIVEHIPTMTLAVGRLTSSIGAGLAMGYSADPSTRADQLSFSTPSLIYSGAGKPKETAAERKAEEERKREERKREEEKKKEERKAAEAEKKRVHADIKEIKAELHIHTTNAKLTKEQINEIVDQAMHQFGRKIGDEIRAQFGNV